MQFEIKQAHQKNGQFNPLFVLHVKVESLGTKKKLAKEWISCIEASTATNIGKHQRVSRKKVFEHARTKAY